MRFARTARSIQHGIFIAIGIMAQGQVALAATLHNGPKVFAHVSAEIVDPATISHSSMDLVQPISSDEGVAQVDITSLKIQGSSQNAYVVSLPADAKVAAADGTGEVLRVTNFTSNGNGIGSQSVMVGATVSVTGSNSPGVYVGTYPVIVNYN